MSTQSQTRLPQPAGAPAARPPAPPTGGLLVLSGTASLGAGAVHVAAAGAHADHPPAAWAFTGLAAAQLLWGGRALVRPGVRTAWGGVLVAAVAVTGWLLSKTAGVPYIAGLYAAEPVQLSDTSAAALALTSLCLALLSLRGLPSAWTGRLPTWAVVAAVSVLAVLGSTAVRGHEHPRGPAAHPVADHPGPVPYDPALPIDLSGTPGVSPRQQAAAEDLLAVTRTRLPRWADARRAEAAGFRSIGDGSTGTEHLINQRFLDDDLSLDPDRPESLVYDTSTGSRRLVAAMYMLRPGTPLDQVPDVGGALVQWHTHEDLCFSRSGRVAGVVDAAGECGPGLVRPPVSPMLHVWIVPHRCGPFAALEGLAGGRIADGEKRLCDHAHGARPATG